MLVAGDEIGRTQQGNNNAYCQDNEISWLNWQQADQDLLAFTQKLISIRRDHPVFSRRRWFQGQPIKGIGVEDIAWFLPNGDEMNEEHWNQDFAKSMAVYLSGRGIHYPGPKGEQILDDNFYLIFNAHHEPLDYKLPEKKYGESWSIELDTSKKKPETGQKYKASEVLKVEARSVMLLKSPLQKQAKK